MIEKRGKENERALLAFFAQPPRRPIGAEGGIPLEERS